MRFQLLCGVVLAASSITMAIAQPAGGFRHVVVIVQENRTPDNLFGSNPTFEPGVDIATSGRNSLGQTIPLTAERIDSCYDVKHANSDWLALYDNGRMDGADQEDIRVPSGCSLPANPQFKFADNSGGTINPYFFLAAQYGFANRMFQTNEGPSLPAHHFLFGGTSAPTATSPLFAAENPASGGFFASGCTASASSKVAVIDQYGQENTNPPVYPCFDRATMADLLDRAGLSWLYYMNTSSAAQAPQSIWNAPAGITRICGSTGKGGNNQCAGAEYRQHVSSTRGQVLADIQNCQLAAVTWVIPNAADSDHAGATDPTGPAWVASIVNAIGQTRCGFENYWQDTAILITWDDWGGWYDHVPPPAVNRGSGWGAGYTYGFRVPLLTVSAYTPAGYVDNTVHDFGSILAFIENNFGLPHIGQGNYADAHASGLSAFFSLKSPRGFQTVPAQRGIGYFRSALRAATPLDSD